MKKTMWSFLFQLRNQPHEIFFTFLCQQVWIRILQFCLWLCWISAGRLAHSLVLFCALPNCLSPHASLRMLEFLDIKPGLWIRIHLIRTVSGSSISGWRPVRIQIHSWSKGFDGHKLEKNYSWKKIFFVVDQTTIYLSLGLHKGRPRFQRSLQLSKWNIQHFKTWNFLIFFYLCGSFLTSWIRIRILWPD
jgi:hypothetical protein